MLRLRCAGTLELRATADPRASPVTRVRVAATLLRQVNLPFEPPLFPSEQQSKPLQAEALIEK